MADIGGSASSPTGDVRDDSESVQIPFKQFLEKFYKALQENSAVGVQEIYEKDYPMLAERNYKAQALPEWESFEASLEPSDQKIMLSLLYNEICYRHLYQRQLLSLFPFKARAESFKNYSSLFVTIIPTDAKAAERAADLPPSVVWELVDEFVYQFERFAVQRSSFAAALTADRARPRDIGVSREPAHTKRDEAVKDLLSAFPSATRLRAKPAWSPNAVLATLHSIVERSGVVEWAKVERSSSEPVPLKHMLGYYAALQLVRVYCLIGDYNTALRCVSFVDLSQPRAATALWTRVPAAQVHLYYYVSLALSMLRRPFDAITTLTLAISFCQRLRPSAAAKGAAGESIGKRLTQLHALLHLNVQLCPIKITDEAINSQMKEKLSDRDLFARIAAGESAAYAEAFALAAPKFLPQTAPLDELVSLAEAHRDASALCGKTEQAVSTSDADDVVDGVASAASAGGAGAVAAARARVVERMELVASRMRGGSPADAATIAAMAAVASSNAAAAAASAAASAPAGAGVPNAVGAVVVRTADTQRKLFVKELVDAAPVRALRSYFGLFAVATTQKLASFSAPPGAGGEVSAAAVEAMRISLLMLRAKTTQLTAATDLAQKVKPLSDNADQFISEFDYAVSTDASGIETIRVDHVPFYRSDFFAFLLRLLLSPSPLLSLLSAPPIRPATPAD